jgi:hypothetical protein
VTFVTMMTSVAIAQSSSTVYSTDTIECQGGTTPEETPGCLPKSTTGPTYQPCPNTTFCYGPPENQPALTRRSGSSTARSRNGRPRPERRHQASQATLRDARSRSLTQHRMYGRRVFQQRRSPIFRDTQVIPLLVNLTV